MALGLAEQESKFGTSKRYKAKRVIGDGGILLLKGLEQVLGKGSIDAPSRGLTQIKMGSDNEELQEIYKGLRLTNENMKRPYNSALATMARLAYMYNNEVRAGKFTGENCSPIDKYDVLLYKWNGHNEQLTRHTATPKRNNYLNNVKKYSNLFDLYETRTYNKYKYGGKLRRLENLGKLSD